MASRRTTTVVLSLSYVVVGVAVGWYLHSGLRRRRRRRRKQKNEHCGTNNNNNTSAYESLIGQTPCIHLPNVSKLAGRQIFVKMESWNPGGTGKDRAAASMIAAAEASGLLPEPRTTGVSSCCASTSLRNFKFENSSSTSTNNTNNSNHNNDDDDAILHEAMQRSYTGGLIVEGTSGSTGIALAALATAKGHACLVVLPDDQASEKKGLLEVLGAIVHVVATAAITNPQHYVNVANRLATRAVSLHQIQAVFMNQFENLANVRVHYETTGPEIWHQCHPDAFVMSAGTGGSISGVAKYLKEQGNCRVVLVDPVGSVLYSKVEHGVAFTTQQRERALLRHRYDSIAEGIGLDRITANMEQGLPFVDTAITVSDQEAVDMAHYILKHEGLLVGSSSAMNLVGAVRTAMEFPKGSGCRVCTVICDSGQRHVTRFWNRDFIHARGLRWPENIVDSLPECIMNLAGM